MQKLFKFVTCCWDDEEEEKEKFSIDDEELTDSKPLLKTEKKDKKESDKTKNSCIPKTSTLLHVNQNFNLTDKNFKTIILAFGFDDDGSIKVESKKERENEIEDLGPYNDYVSQEEVVEYKEVDIDFIIKVEAHTHWGCKINEISNEKSEISGVQFLQVNPPEKLKMKRVFVNLSSLDSHTAYLLFKVYIPNQSKQLETSYETKWEKGFLRKFVYKKIPRTNRFITRCIPNNNEECCRCITLIDPIHKPEDNLTGMLYLDNDSDHWNFRSTFSFHVFPPTQLFVTIKKGKDLPVSTDEEVPTKLLCNIQFLKQQTETKPKSDFTWNDETFLFNMKDYSPKEKMEITVKDSSKEVIGTIELDLLGAFEIEKSKFVQDKSPKLVHEAWYKLLAKQKKEDDVMLNAGEILLELRLEWN